MCGRTSLYTPVPELEERFDATAVKEFPPRYNIAPTDDIAVITNEERSEIDLARWGLVPHWKGNPNDGPQLINARAETIDQKASFRESFERRRCLVLSNGFYEWQQRRGGKQPYRIAKDDDSPFAFAGLWERWQSNGTTIDSCTIITTEANSIVEPIHDRMPVILECEHEEEWLFTENADERKALLKPYPGQDLTAYPISTQVNNPAHNSPEILVEANDQRGQSGLEDFT